MPFSFLFFDHCHWSKLHWLHNTFLHFQPLSSPIHSLCCCLCSVSTHTNLVVSPHPHTFPLSREQPWKPTCLSSWTDHFRSFPHLPVTQNLSHSLRPLSRPTMTAEPEARDRTNFLPPTPACYIHLSIAPHLAKAASYRPPSCLE